MSNCMYTAQGDFVCKEDTKENTIENFNTYPNIPINNIDGCYNCSINNDILTCQCLNKGGIYASRQLKLNNCNLNNNINYINNSNIINDQDERRLTCISLYQPNGRVCNNCKYSTTSNNIDKLTCSCQKNNGMFKNTTLDNCYSRSIKNSNGDLRCS